MLLRWLAALCCVAAMGMAIQRGATCTVAAVDEVLNKRRAHKLVAMLEAALWVAGGLVLAQLAGLAGSMPLSYAATRWTVIGGVLLGLGAWLNGACAFGTVARLGSGDWAYAATPLGFFAGCLSTMPLFSRPAATALGQAPSGWPASPLLALLFLGFVLWRLGGGLWALRQGGRWQRLRLHIAAAHNATVLIGLCFVATLLLAGRWAYTDVLADLALMQRSQAAQLLLPVLLLLALFTGALMAGRQAWRRQSTRVWARQLLRCFAGGAVMGWGSLLIPGSNDGLILIGMPLVQPYAWLAFVTMFASIAAAMRLQRAWRRQV